MNDLSPREFLDRRQLVSALRSLRRGDFSVRRVIWNPRWVPPNSKWARGKKPMGPGPDNPMGRVKIFFKEPRRGVADEVERCRDLRPIDGGDQISRPQTCSGGRTVCRDGLDASPVGGAEVISALSRVA